MGLFIPNAADHLHTNFWKVSKAEFRGQIID